MKRILALVLALLMLVVLFAACKDNNDPNKNQGNNNQGSTDGEPVVRNFGGADYTILVNSYTDYQFKGSMSGGDIVKISVADRQDHVEDAYGVNVKIISKKGGWGEKADFKTAVAGEKSSKGADGINLVATHSVYLGWMCTEGYAQDMSQYSEYIDFNQPWWNKNLYDALNLKGHVFMMLGDIAYTLYEYINVMFVNNSEFQNYFVDQGGTDMLYDLVDAGEWTWEKLWDYASDYGTGAMGDGKYGIITNTHAFRACFVSMNMQLFSRDASGKMTLPDSLSRTNSNIINEMKDMYAKDNLWFKEDYNGTYNNVFTPIFTAGQALFYPQTLDEAAAIFQKIPGDVGVVPLPKYEAMQDMYMTQCRDTVNAVMIINSATNDPKGKNQGEMTAIVTEGMAYYGYKDITPAYYEKSLTDRYLQDYEDILDTIRAGLTYQAGDCYLTGDTKEGTGTMRWDKFIGFVVGRADVQPTTNYESDVATGRQELQAFYYKLGRLGINY